MRFGETMCSFSGCDVVEFDTSCIPGVRTIPSRIFARSTTGDEIVEYIRWHARKQGVASLDLPDLRITVLTTDGNEDPKFNMNLIFPFDERLCDSIPDGDIRLVRVAAKERECRFNQQFDRAKAKLRKAGLDLKDYKKYRVRGAITGLNHTHFGVVLSDNDKIYHLWFDLGLNSYKVFHSAHCFEPYWYNTEYSTNEIDLTIAAVKKVAWDLIIEHGEFRQYSNNCQSYSYRLAKRLGFHRLAERKSFLTRMIWREQ